MFPSWIMKPQQGNNQESTKESIALSTIGAELCLEFGVKKMPVESLFSPRRKGNLGSWNPGETPPCQSRLGQMDKLLWFINVHLLTMTISGRFLGYEPRTTGSMPETEFLDWLISQQLKHTLFSGDEKSEPSHSSPVPCPFCTLRLLAFNPSNC